MLNITENFRIITLAKKYDNLKFIINIKLNYLILFNKI